MRRTAAVLATIAALAVVSACETRPQVDPPDPAPTSTSPTPADVAEHESGPESPISYGLEVPRGATQLGPLVRYRSPRLIQAYQPVLDAAQAQRDAEEAQRRAEAEAEGEPLPSPTPTPQTRPSEDTFALVNDPPKPDVTTSLMRVDGNPTAVLRRMIAQVDAVLPRAGLQTDDIAEYCEAEDRRITSCTVRARGFTVDDRQLEVTITVDPGDVATRTAWPSSKSNPVMTVTVEYVGDPRSGQLDRKVEAVDVPRDVEGEDTSDLIWPKMDEVATSTADLLLGEWTVPPEATVLLSGRQPSFVALSTDRVRRGDEIAEAYVSQVGAPDKDVVEDLNEISTTYTATDADGNTATATFVLSARGNYVMLFSTPPE